jgi:hypothetical protein
MQGSRDRAFPHLNKKPKSRGFPGKLAIRHGQPNRNWVSETMTISRAIERSEFRLLQGTRQKAAAFEFLGAEPLG